VIAASAANPRAEGGLFRQAPRYPRGHRHAADDAEIKVDAVRSFGAEVVLEGDHYGEAQRYSAPLAAERGMVFVHPFDDPMVIAGQGTIAVELVRQRPAPISRPSSWRLAAVG
jgi:threonine dehydratase